MKRGRDFLPAVKPVLRFAVDRKETTPPSSGAHPQTGRGLYSESFASTLMPTYAALEQAA